jgi:hypothetical protein
MQSLVVSESGGTRLSVDDGQWVLHSSRGAEPAEGALVALLPLLEREPHHGLAALAALHGPAFPWEPLLQLALSGDSGYWQEKAVPWLDALACTPDGAMADAARHALEQRRAGQRHRQRLRRWLQGKSVRGL